MEISSIESLLLSAYCESPACSSVTDSDIIAFGGYYYLSLTFTDLQRYKGWASVFIYMCNCIFEYLSFCLVICAFHYTYLPTNFTMSASIMYRSGHIYQCGYIYISVGVYSVGIYMYSSCGYVQQFWNACKVLLTLANTFMLQYLLLSISLYQTHQSSSCGHMSFGLLQ